MLCRALFFASVAMVGCSSAPIRETCFCDANDVPPAPASPGPIGAVGPERPACEPAAREGTSRSIARLAVPPGVTSFDDLAIGPADVFLLAKNEVIAVERRPAGAERHLVGTNRMADVGSIAFFPTRVDVVEPDLVAYDDAGRGLLVGLAAPGRVFAVDAEAWFWTGSRVVHVRGGVEDTVVTIEPDRVLQAATVAGSYVYIATKKDAELRLERVAWSTPGRAREPIPMDVAPLAVEDVFVDQDRVYLSTRDELAHLMIVAVDPDSGRTTPVVVAGPVTTRAAFDGETFAWGTFTEGRACSGGVTTIGKHGASKTTAILEGIGRVDLVRWSDGELYAHHAYDAYGRREHAVEEWRR